MASLAVASTETRGWLAAVCAGAGVACFPPVATETGAIFWPDEVTELPYDISFAPGHPVGAIETVEHFATSPKTARFVLLTGTDPSTPLSAAANVWRELNDPGLAGLRRPMKQVLASALRTGAAPTSDAVLALLDELPRVEELGADRIDHILTKIRSWADTGSWVVIPLPGRATCENCLSKPVFKRDTAAGAVVRIKTFGLSSPEGLIRAGEVVISAGPPPHGFTELEAAAAAAPGSKGEELRDAFRALREAGACGYLEQATVDVFKLFWERVRPEWDASDRPAAETFANGLLAMLYESFGLLPLEPANYRDHPPDWVVVPPGTRMVTGRVTRVIRPGLIADDVLRLPALIEAE